jgi:hypothetical protein
MKKLFVVVIAVIVFASCATTKSSKVVTPAGAWDYAITGTPEGDFSGDFIITSQDKKYAASLKANGQELPFNSCAWDQANNKVTGDFNYSGYNIFFEATMSGEELKGTISAEGEHFPFKATRKK